MYKYSLFWRKSMNSSIERTVMKKIARVVYHRITSTLEFGWTLSKLVLLKSIPLFKLAEPTQCSRGSVRHTNKTERFDVYFNKIFSSPELKAQVSFSDRLSSVVCLFHLLLQNHLANFNQTWHKVFLGEGDSSLFKWRATPFPKGR